MQFHAATTDSLFQSSSQNCSRLRATGLDCPKLCGDTNATCSAVSWVSTIHTRNTCVFRFKTSDNSNTTLNNSNNWLLKRIGWKIADTNENAKAYRYHHSLALAHWNIVPSWYPYWDLSEHLLTGVTRGLPVGFKVLPGHAHTVSCPSISTKTKRTTCFRGEPQRLHTVAIRPGRL